MPHMQESQIKVAEAADKAEGERWEHWCYMPYIKLKHNFQKDLINRQIQTGPQLRKKRQVVALLSVFIVEELRITIHGRC